MINVRQAVRLLRGAEYIGVVWGGSTTEIDPDSDIDMDAYGDYLVRKIAQGYGENRFELYIAARPMRGRRKR